MSKTKTSCSAAQRIVLRTITLARSHCFYTGRWHQLEKNDGSKKNGLIPKSLGFQQ